MKLLLRLRLASKAVGIQRAPPRQLHVSLESRLLSTPLGTLLCEGRGQMASPTCFADVPQMISWALLESGSERLVGSSGHVKKRDIVELGFLRLTYCCK